VTDKYDFSKLSDFLAAVEEEERLLTADPRPVESVSVQFKHRKATVVTVAWSVEELTYWATVMTLNHIDETIGVWREGGEYLLWIGMPRYCEEVADKYPYLGLLEQKLMDWDKIVIPPEKRIVLVGKE